ncbi:SDR family NAD(P)-dependent oxidoreductase [Ornithinimicrobium sediminis]|uniref:SDR family NAD(P)-dependent oxidoreductase n=1 Tax=Ornithinimicrobium sediminis TaxID=2904603 RepID=UPI001E2EE323|nr:SDR family NAD(P)-dependent oxidoreductase [Ornithinimicrobium sediminis]MCE0487097.1 SDR family NAD(P)-dependent oxidoreductase [Ornithinimicrobium sediminis]
MAGHTLDGAVVAVVGASGALGSLIAKDLAGRGARVVLVGRDEDRLRAVGLDDAPRVVADLTDATAGERIVQAAREAYGRLDGVVNAAGVVAFGPLVDTDDAVVEDLFMTNVIGPLWMIRRVAPVIAESGGFVCNISAVVAEQPMPGMSAYAASKAALTAADKALVRELRRMKVSVIDARPPHTETGLATRPLAGEAPTLPQGLEPQAVARRIVQAIEDGQPDVPAADFAG